MNEKQQSRSKKLHDLSLLLKKNKCSTAYSKSAASSGVSWPDANDSDCSNKQKQIDSTINAVKSALAGFGVLAPTSSQQQVWNRSIPSTLYQTPKCTPALTTIMPLSRVPPGAKICGQQPSNNDGNADVLVEVWKHSLTSNEESGNQAAGDVQHRPLQGNLSSKLSEYTRGTMGVRRPFRPGGMDDDDDEYQDDDIKEDIATTVESKYLSEEAVTNARRALTLGSKKAWEEGILITSPPGVSFRVGLSYDDVFTDGDNLEMVDNSGGDDEDGDELAAKVAALSMDDDVGTAATFAGNAFAVPSSTIWDKKIFDDDSLFGESTSGSESDSEESEDDNIEEEGNDDLETSEVAEEKPPAKEPEFLSPEDEVDSLLAEMKHTLQSPIDRAMAEKKVSTSIHPNLSTGSSDDQKNTKNRKSWAVTDYIPLTDDADFHTLCPNPALTFPFELDDFQKQAILRLEKRQCVFLAAHTSAGKTVCAEYAVALAKKHCTRAIYTSPIKALSNQKYRDFRSKFGEDVGLITGDMQIGADGSCLIMTTEILRSMLYRGADLIRDIEWVIFDEVHYINDSERGVVWEEVIIMLPEYVNMIFLSATTPNTIEFSEWIGRTKRKPVHVIRTNYRPVPLSHHLWAGHKMHKIMEGKQGFDSKGYAAASKALLPASARAKVDAKSNKGGSKANTTTGKQSSVPGKPASGSKLTSWQQQGTKQDWISLTRHLEKEGLMPTVTFSFSKKKCEEIANQLRSLDLNTAAERNLVQSFAIQTVARLSPKDQILPQVVNTVEMVKRGVGVHHGGLLPILKEMVEILFSRNLIKILFATETFAMGVNMPARSVVFNAIRKHDGVQFRELQPGEYVQMAGRAGRRGLDTVGTVVLCCFGDHPPPQTMLKNMLTGSSTKLQSQFRLTYTMILNLLRVEDMSVEGMIKRSFSEFATQRALTNNEYPKLLTRGTKTLAKLDEEFKHDVDSRIGAEDIEEYYASSSNVLSSAKELLCYILSSGGTGGGALVAGRLVLVTSARKHGYVRAPAVVLKPPTPSSNISSASSNESDGIVCIVLLPQSYTSVKDKEGEPVLGDLNYVGLQKDRFYVIHELSLDEILLVSDKKCKIDSNVLLKEKSSSMSIRRGALGNPFAGARSMQRREADDPFAGMNARGKKNDDTSRNKPSVSQETQVVDDVVTFLMNSEETELQTGLGVLDLRDCAKNMHQGNSAVEFGAAYARYEQNITLLRHFRSHYHPILEIHYKVVDRREILRSRVRTLRKLLSNESLQLFPDFLQRKALLQTLGYVDENDTVCLKGRVACEVNTCEGLIVTEMVFGGLLSELEPTEIVAALSALIFQEKTDEEFDSELPERLVASCNGMKAIALDLGQRQKDHGLPVDPLEYCATSLKMGLVHVVYEWACGVPFSSICELTDVQEGSIVRCITRLDELCREVRNCARVVGNPTLYRKMEMASEAIKRDIVFASSLYVS